MELTKTTEPTKLTPACHGKKYRRQYFEAITPPSPQEIQEIEGIDPKVVAQMNRRVGKEERIANRLALVIVIAFAVILPIIKAVQ